MPIARYTEIGRIDGQSLDEAMGLALGDRYHADLPTISGQREIYLDTPEWRLHAAGWTLVHDPAEQTLTATRAGNSPLSQPAPSLARFPLLGDLPPGPVTAAVGGPMGIRALVPVVEVQVRRTGVDVRNPDAKIVARVRRRELRISGVATVVGDIEVEPLRGYDTDGERIGQALTDSGRFAPVGSDDFAVLTRTAGIGPLAAHTRPLTAEQPADVAVAQTLSGFLADLVDTVPGTLDDVDTEYLHDLRVAVRRIRSMLKRVGDVLPAAVFGPFRDEFRWLGQLTTPTRDLDVFLLEFDALRERVSSPDDLSAFHQYLRSCRGKALRQLRSGLRSDRFAALCTDFRAACESVGGDGERPGVRSCRELAAARIRKVYRQVARDAAAVTAAAPAEQVHDLRKTGKDLRYLLEVFKPVCEPAAHLRVVRDLKRLQDVLGAFQDGEVQAAALRRFAQDMLDAGERRASVILAMGELAAHFETEQRAARAELDAQHAAYLGPQTARRVAAMVRG